MDKITIQDLSVICRIGVPEAERAKPQRLLVTVDLLGDFSEACLSDDILATINYYEVAQRIESICASRPFKLLESLAHEIVSCLLKEFGPDSVHIEIKKFILPNTRYVSISLTRDR
jgi:dihydroneopterin aldolase